MLDRVSSKQGLFSCPSRVHLWFVDSLCFDSRNRFFDGPGGGSGSCGRTRRLHLPGAGLHGHARPSETKAEAAAGFQMIKLDARRRCHVSLCLQSFCFSGVVSRRGTSLWKTALQPDRSPMRPPPSPPPPPPTFQVSPQPDVGLCSSKMLLMNAEAS